MTDRATLAAGLLEHLDTWRELHRLAATEEQLIRATWAALQALDSEQDAQVAVRLEAHS